MNAAYTLGERLLDLLFPPRCVNCKRVTGALCAKCSSAIQPLTASICPCCGRAPYAGQDICPECQAHPLTITQIRSATWHEGAAREAIHALKYKRRRDTVAPLSKFLAGQLVGSHLEFDLITSVPLYSARQSERGYNQAELLAQETARLTHTTYLPVLARTRATADQIGLNAAARRVNVQDAFRAIQPSLSNKTIVLVDDVCTTGATLDACAQALFAAGAQAVYGLAVARPRWTG